jgi:hypothetical protein
MGRMRFTIRFPRVLAPAVQQRAYLASPDGYPWQSKVKLEDGCLEINRDEADSGYFNLPILIDGLGERMLTTSCLMEKAQPYDLCIELIRGTVNRLNQQYLSWKEAGLETPKEFLPDLEKLKSEFATLATSPESTSETVTLKLLADSLNLGDKLASLYVDQVLKLRHERQEKLPLLCGVRLHQPPKKDQLAQVLALSNAATVNVNWRSVEKDEGKFDWTESKTTLEFCRSQKLKTVCGPLLDLRSFALPDWIYLYEDSFEDLTDTVLHFTGDAVKQLAPFVQIWNVAASMNGDLAIELSEERRLKLTLSAIETVRRADPKKPLIVTLSQPWSEYLAWHDWELPAINFADDLLRSGVGLTGIGLEIDIGYSQPGDTPRDLLAMSRMLDQWSLLQVPLVIWLSAPAVMMQPAKNQRKGVPLVGLHGAEPSDLLQAKVARDWYPMLLAKQCVHAIFWNQLTDDTLGGAAAGGLFNSDGQPREVTQVLTEIRKTRLAP